MTRHTLATLILLSAIPLAATAAEPAKDSSQAGTTSMFNELDQNRDGQISQSEAQRSADVTARFSTLDTDQNKSVSLAEWQAGNKTSPRGAAGSTGESHDQGSMKGQSKPGTPEDAPKSSY